MAWTLFRLRLSRITMVALKPTKRSTTAASLAPSHGIETHRARADHAAASGRRTRKVYDAAFKLMVVREALKLPASNRIKPTCRAYPGVEPVRASARARPPPSPARPLPHLPARLPIGRRSPRGIHLLLTLPPQPAWTRSSAAGASAQVDS